MDKIFAITFNDNIYHEGNISKMPDFDVFLFWNVKNVKVDLIVNIKMATLSAKFVLKNAKIPCRFSAIVFYLPLHKF